jgi:hypothetical protein
MADLDRAYVTWTGFPGAPGVSVFYATPGGGVAAALRTFFAALQTSLPTGVTVSVPSTGDTIDDTTGFLTGSWSGAGGSPVVGNSGSTYSAPSGIAVRWNTNGIVGTRRLRGRTFIVPMSGTFLTAQGTWSSALVSAVQAAASGLVAAGTGHFSIWSRPVDSDETAIPPIAGRVGSSSPVTSATVTSKVCVLTSRRD